MTCRSESCLSFCEAWKYGLLSVISDSVSRSRHLPPFLVSFHLLPQPLPPPSIPSPLRYYKINVVERGQFVAEIIL